MKHSSLSLLVILWFISAIPAQPPVHHGMDKGFREKKLNTIHFLKMEEELELSEEQSDQLLPMFRKHRTKLHQLIMQRMNTIREMIELCHKEQFDENLSLELMNKLEEIDQQIEKNIQDFKVDVKEIINPKQYLQFMVFEATFAERIREILNEMRPGTHSEENKLD